MACYTRAERSVNGEIREMIKCVKIEDVLTCIIFQVVGKDLTCGELKKIIENLPTIVIGKESTFENLIDEAYPIGSPYYNHYGLATDPNDAFYGTTWEDCGSYWIRVK